MPQRIKISDVTNLAAELVAAASSGGVSGVVSPKDAPWNAVGDVYLPNGTLNPTPTNDYAALNACLNYAFDNGLTVDGGEAVYATNENSFTISNKKRPHIQRLRLKQIAPEHDTITLGFENCQQIRIDDLYIHIGDSPSIGTRDVSHALRITGGSGHRINNVEATGQGKGTYLMFWKCTDTIIINPYVHDGLFFDGYIDAYDNRIRVEDDVVEGIRVQDCVNTTVINPIIRDLLGNATYYTASGFQPGNYLASTVKPFPNMRTRGMSGGGNDGLEIINPRISNVDQAIDFSGNGGNWGNKKLHIMGGHTFNCGSVGVKLGAGPTECMVSDHISENIGMYCYLIAGTSEMFEGRGYQINNCLAINPGYNDCTTDAGDPVVNGQPNPQYIQNAHTGFCLFAPHPRGLIDVDVNSCKASWTHNMYLAGDDPYNPDSPQGPTLRWPNAGETTAYLQFPWTGYTGQYNLTFQIDNNTTISGTSYPSGEYADEYHSHSEETKLVTLTNGSKTITWTGGLSRRVTRPNLKRASLMTYGFMCFGDDGLPIAFDTQSKRPILLHNSRSEGHTIAAEYGFHRLEGRWGRNGNSPSISNGASYNMPFDKVIDDTLNMRPSSNHDRIYPRIPGIYDIEGSIHWQAGGGGYRKIELLRNGSVNEGVDSIAGPSSEQATHNFKFRVNMTKANVDADNFFILELEQASGGSLAVLSSSWLSVKLVRQL